MSNSLQLYGLQHASLPYLPLSHGVRPSSCPLSCWRYLTGLFSVTLFSFLPPIFPCIRVFSSESALHKRWPKDWSFSFSINEASVSNKYSELISFRIDWFDFLAVQGTLKSLLHHHSSKATIFQHSAFFMVQLSHPYMTTGKNHSLTRWTFVGKVMSAF